MTTILISVPTILLSSTAPSVLSRRSVSVCAALPSGKMLPVDLGRFFRPYGAEHMHAHPPPEPSQTQRAMPSLFWWLLCPLWRRRRHADAAGCGLFFPPPCLMPKAPPAAVRDCSPEQDQKRYPSSSLHIPAERRVTFSPS